MYEEQQGDPHPQHPPHPNPPVAGVENVRTKLGAPACVLSTQDDLKISTEENNYTKQLVYGKIGQHCRLNQIKSG